MQPAARRAERKHLAVTLNEALGVVGVGAAEHRERRRYRVVFRSGCLGGLGWEIAARHFVPGAGAARDRPGVSASFYPILGGRPKGGGKARRPPQVTAADELTKPERAPIEGVVALVQWGAG